MQPTLTKKTLVIALLAILSAGIVQPSLADDHPTAAQQQQADDAWEAQQAKLPPEQRPFDIKGDRLGMSLAAFKRKHHRDLGPSKPPAPHCSDRRPDQDNPMLFYKAEMAKAGIVSASPTYPHEAFEAKPVKPTLAGVDAERFICKFIDGKLYEISVSFEQKHFTRVKEALKAKFGEPRGSGLEVDQSLVGPNSGGDMLRWSNEVSSILLCQRAGDQTSLLLVTDKRLSAEAESRLTKVRASQDP